MQTLSFISSSARPRVPDTSQLSQPTLPPPLIGRSLIPPGFSHGSRVLTLSAPVIARCPASQIISAGQLVDPIPSESRHQQKTFELDHRPGYYSDLHCPERPSHDGRSSTITSSAVYSAEIVVTEYSTRIVNPPEELHHFQP